MLSANYHNHTQMQEIFKLQRLKPKMIISQKDFTQDISSYWIKMSGGGLVYISGILFFASCNIFYC